MSDTKLLLWCFEEAPVQLRLVLPMTCAHAWLAFVCPGSSLEVVEVLIARWRISGQTVLRYEVSDGGIILVGSPAANDRHVV